jgi:hypothetical protein
LDAAFYPQMNPADLRRSYDSLVATGEWCIVDAVHGYVLLERRGEGAGDCLRELPDAFCDFARVSDPQPQVRVQADFGDGLRLLGYDITQVPYWRRVGVRLYWQLLGGSDGGPALPAANYRLYPFWLGAGGAVVETTTQRPLVEPVWCPTNTWRPGKTMVTEMLPWDLGPEFRLGLAVMDEANQRLRVHLGPSDPPVYAMDGATWLRLQVFEWQNGRVRPVDEAAVPAQALAAEFDGRLALAGFTLSPADPQAGQEMKLYLLWQAAAPVQPDYTAFVHLLDARGERVAQGDGVPNYLGALPTSLWRVGVPVLDIHTLVLPPDLAPGGYSLRIGWYDPQTGERLTLATGEDSLLLSEVQVR